MSTPSPCAWCGRPCPGTGKERGSEGVRGDSESPPWLLTPLLPSQPSPPLCLACTLLSEFEETDESERWNYPEQHWEEQP